MPAPNLINEFRVNASWASQNIPPYGEDWKRSTYGFTFPYLFPAGTGNYRQNGIPDVAISWNLRTIQEPAEPGKAWLTWLWQEQAA